jgi:large repetitive protein
MLSPSRRWSRTAAIVTVLGVLLALFAMVPVASAAPGDFTITGQSKNEGTGSTTTFTFTVTVEGPYVGQVSYTVNSGTAKAGEDFLDPGAGTLAFVGETSRTIDVTVNADAFSEPNETFSVTLSNPVPGSCGSSCTATATIVNDDGPAAVASVSSPTVAEDAAGGTADFVVTLDKAPVTDQTITIDYRTTGGTAKDPADFDGGTGSVTFEAGETEETIEIPIVDDGLDEDDETFTLTITPSNATCTTCTGTATITNDDVAPTVSIADLAQAEGNTGVTSFDFAVTLSEPSGRTITVEYATVDGEDDTATPGADYVVITDTVTFIAGQTTTAARVGVVADLTHEPAEAFTVQLTSADEATITDGTATGTITNDDGVPSLRIDNAPVTEGSTGTTDATFTVSLSRASGNTVTVAYTTAEGSATDPEDFASRSGTLTFAPGEVTKTITVPVVADALDEPNETFTVVLSGAANATIADATGVGTINNDDATPTLSVNDATADEGDTDGTPAGSDATFTITLSAPSGQPVTVTYQTADDTATAGGDYTAKAATPVTFEPGETTKEIVVDVLPDNTDEPDETFTLNLSAPTNATLADASGTGTITDDDAGATFSISDAFVTETDTPGATLVFTVNKTGSTTSTITVPYATEDGSATDPEDYEAQDDALVFAPGDTAKTITVNVVGDNISEPTETMLVRLNPPTPSGTLTDAVGEGTIQDDENNPPSVSIADASTAEGTGGTKDLTFTVTRSPSPPGNPGDVTVFYETRDGTAKAGSDYTTTSGSVTIPANQTTATIDVPITTDSVDEPDEAFTVVLLRARNANIGDGTATGTITDDDNAPVISATAPTVVEGTGDAVELVFTVSLSNGSSSNVTVNYATSDGTATEGRDYTGRSGTLTFAPGGSLSQDVVMSVNGDDISEADETVRLTLSSPNGGTIGGTNPAIGTITDDDPEPAISVADATVVEGDAGAATADFSVTLSAASEQTITVRVNTADGTATAPGDYTAVVDELVTFDPGEVSKTVTVDVAGDTVDEADETFDLELTGATNASIADDTATATITDDDDAPVLSIGDATVTEGNDGTVDATFTITKAGATEQEVTVTVDTADGTATSPGDYTAVADQLVTFAPGDDTETVTVAVLGDTIDEALETFAVVLRDAGNATIAEDAGTGTGSISDDDPLPTLSVADVTVAEGDSGTTPASFVVTLSAASGRTVTVDYATANGTATGADYTATSGELTFSPGQTTKSVVVSVKGDTVDEANETFTLVLSSPANATHADGSATGTITDDDEPAAPPVTPESGQGYSLVGEDGSLYAYGTAKNRGDMKGTKLNAPVIGVAYTPGGNGYWLVARDGGIFTFGDADFYGSMGAKPLNSPVIGMAATPTGKGYWLFAGDGGIFTFGDAEFFGSMGDKKLNAPVINMEPLASGNGYWLVAADGGIFTFGQAEFFGSMGDSKLNQPVFDMTSTDTDKGYWLIARDGGIFSFGDAESKFYGNPVNDTNPRPTRIIGMDSSPGSLGYWIADANGKVWNFGNAEALGDRYLAANPAPMIGFASVAGPKP